MKYLFCAFFADGSHVQQTLEDVAVAVQPTPERPRPSAFSDVAQHQSRLTNFHLVSEDGDDWGLDLTTLDFSHNGNLFRLHNLRDLPLTDVQIRYFRNKKRDIHITAEDRMIILNQGEDILHSFQLGWTAKNVKGEEVTRFIEIW